MSSRVAGLSMGGLERPFQATHQPPPSCNNGREFVHPSPPPPHPPPSAGSPFVNGLWCPNASVRDSDALRDSDTLTRLQIAAATARLISRLRAACARCAPRSAHRGRRRGYSAISPTRGSRSRTGWSRPAAPGAPQCPRVSTLEAALGSCARADPTAATPPFSSATAHVRNCLYKARVSSLRTTQASR